jgi:general secretion pathway protein H
MRRKRDRTHRARRGFTLIEVLVVMVLIGLILGVVAPYLPAVLPGVELRTTTRELAGALRHARSQALLQGESALVVDLEQRRYALDGGSRMHHVPERVALTLVTAESEQRGDAAGAIRFFGDGSSTGGRVTLSDGRRSFHVDVDWITGRVSVHE